jgi:hypothetical protein
MYYEILNVSLDLVESYSPKVTNGIDYLGCFYFEQILIKENIDVY